MKKRLKIVTSLAALILVLGSSRAVWGLGLGDIQAESALNEPLVARIELLNVSTLSDRDLIVDIGSREDYRIAGVERDFFHTDLILEAYIDGQSTPYISVTSTRPVIEPFVNFVVQIRWPQGKLLREYTILLDLPVFTGQSQQRQPDAPKKTASRPARSASRISIPGKASRATGKSKVDAGAEYLVRNGDTLWSLAENIARDTGATRQQVILAIRDGNPDAFMNGNLNALKSGVILRMPDRNQAGQRSVSDAAAEFANIQKRGGRALDATPVSSSSHNFRERSTADSPPEGRLALTSSAALGAGSSANPQESEADSHLVNALTSENETLKEELDRVAVENDDLRQRLSALEEQLEVVELLSVENNELAAVQAGLEAAGEASSEPAAAGLAVEDEGTAEPESSVTETDSAAGAESTAQPVSPDVQTEPTPSLMDRLFGFLPYIGALLVVILLVVMMAMKRRKATAEDDDLLADELDADDDLFDDEPEEIESEKTTSFAADESEGDDNFEEGLESMDELFAGDSAEPEATEEADVQQAEETEVVEEIDAVDEEDVEDVDLEGALEDLDEFADLDSFFDSDDIEDFDPDAAESLEGDEGDSPAQDADDDIELEAGASDTEEEFDIDGSAEGEQDSGSDSMDFDDEIELPEPDESSDEDTLEPPSDDANSMEFDLDDFDPVGDADTKDGEAEAEPEPAGNEMEFDAESIELPVKLKKNLLKISTMKSIQWTLIMRSNCLRCKRIRLLSRKTRKTRWSSTWTTLSCLNRIRRQQMIPQPWIWIQILKWKKIYLIWVRIWKLTWMNFWRILLVKKQIRRKKVMRH